MASVNPHTRELVFKLVFKVVYYGPGLGGKTTSLQYLHATAKPEHRGKLVSLATPVDRTLYFDFLPIRVPRVRGMAVRLQLFTVPGQVYYAATRKLVLSGADGVVFVADSQAGRLEVNQESLDDLHANLAEHNRSLEEVPHTFHWNKRDLVELASLEELDQRFNAFGAPSIGTVATRGEGVFEGLERITRLVLKAYESDPKVRIEPTGNLASSGERGAAISAQLNEDGVALALRQIEAPIGGLVGAGGGEAPRRSRRPCPTSRSRPRGCGRSRPRIRRRSPARSWPSPTCIGRPGAGRRRTRASPARGRRRRLRASLIFRRISRCPSPSCPPRSSPRRPPQLPVPPRCRSKAPRLLRERSPSPSCGPRANGSGCARRRR